MRTGTMSYFYKSVILTLLVLSFSYQSLAGTWADDFSNKDTTNWEIYNLAAWQHDLDVDIAKWNVVDGEVRGSILALFMESMFLTGELNWKYYSVSCKAKFVGNEKKTASLGLILHARIEENKRYMFLINYFDQKASIVATAGKLQEEGDPFIGWTKKVYDFKLKFDTWYLLSASVLSNDKLEFKIRNLSDRENNGEFSIEVLKPIRSGGLTGFYVANAAAVFDDIRIQGENIPNGGTYPVKPQSKLATTWSRIKKDKT